MKTSNKILLGTFVFIVLLLTGLHAAMRIKYEQGDIVVLNSKVRAGELFVKKFGNVKHVSVTGVQMLTILPSDSAWTPMPEEGANKPEYFVLGDTLVVDGGLTTRDYESGRKVSAENALFLPPDVSVTARYARISLVGTLDSTKAGSRHIGLEEASLTLSAPDNQRTYFGRLAITAGKSAVKFYHGAVIADLQINLSDDSELQVNRATIDHVSLQIDSTSVVTLRKDNLKKFIPSNE